MREEQLNGLWRNCSDSLRHALYHFSEARLDKDDFHNRKWAILSVAHAAEVYCNLLLSVLDDAHPKGRYPSLEPARTMLKDNEHLSAGERLVVGEVLGPLVKARNVLMHMPAPEELSISETAVALLALLHIVRRRAGVKTEEFVDQDPPAEQDVYEGLTLKHHQYWSNIVERLLLEEYRREDLTHCAWCGVLAIAPETGCQACYHTD